MQHGPGEENELHLDFEEVGIDEDEEAEAGLGLNQLNDEAANHWPVSHFTSPKSVC